MIDNILDKLRDASYSLAFLEESKVKDVLNGVADAIEKETESDCPMAAVLLKMLWTWPAWTSPTPCMTVLCLLLTVSRV